jgi:hypothetical protein
LMAYGWPLREANSRVDAAGRMMARRNQPHPRLRNSTYSPQVVGVVIMRP